MDRKQMIIQRARDYFAERLDDVLHMVRQDRQELRGWEEPAHLRAVVRFMGRENGTPTSDSSSVGVTEMEFGRTAGEPDRGQQRESMGLLLEAGAVALEKIAQHTSEVTAEEILGLECLLLIYARPAIQACHNQLAAVPPFWNNLEDQREDIEMAQRGVGRIELLGHPEYDWAGTGFLVNETTLMTTRRTAELFAERRDDSWQFRPGITAWMNYRSAYQNVSSAGYRIRSILGIHDVYDLALLDVEPPQINGTSPMPLALSAQPPNNLERRQVYLIGYPVRDTRRNEPERVARIFRDVYNVKRVQPGMLRGCLRFEQVELLHHDCAPLGQTCGSCLIDLETHQVLGMQLSSRYLENSTAIPLWTLRNDPLLQRAHVTFAEATSTDREQLVGQVERLARSRYWEETRRCINDLYRRAFGREPGVIQ